MTRRLASAERPTLLSREEFTRLLNGCERGLRIYILSMVPVRCDADEVFQATCVQLWEELPRFERGSDFAAWAAKVAYYQVLSFRKRQSRERLRFSDELVDSIGSEAVELVTVDDRRQQALAACLARLEPQQREIIELRYTHGAAVEDVAARLGKSAAAVYKALSRIRLLLHDAVERACRNDDEDF